MKDLGACLRHPGEPALFRCRQCHDAVCVGCEAPDEAPRRIPWGRYAIALLVTLDLGLAGYLVLAGRSDTAITQGVKAVNAVARAVQESRDPAGRYPESLAPVLPRLPEPVAEMIRAGAIQYETYDNRTDYTVSFVLGPRRSSR
jgi:hypothetical protein